MDETREVNVGNKVVKPIHHSRDLKKPERHIFNSGYLKKPERHIFNSNIWTVIPYNDILFIDTAL